MTSGDTPHQAEHFYCPACLTKHLLLEAASDRLAGYFDHVMLPWWEHWQQSSLSDRDLNHVVRDDADKFVILSCARVSLLRVTLSN
jgi:hypothetical protein